MSIDDIDDWTLKLSSLCDGYLMSDFFMYRRCMVQ